MSRRRNFTFSFKAKSLTEAVLKTSAIAALGGFNQPISDKLRFNFMGHKLFNIILDANNYFFKLKL